jgi:tripartite-type tricarboxylate transporter receptor subunit TctC
MDEPAAPVVGRERMALPRRTFLRLAGAAAAVPALSWTASAQAYPTRPVRLIVGFAPAGPTDVFARLMAQKLSDHFGKQFYVDNIVGGSGNVATGQAAKAPPDGHTVLVAFSTFVVNPILFDKVPYDPVKDFAPVTLAVSSTTVLSVNPSVPARTVAELVALIRSGSGKYSYATGGTGSQTHLAGEQFRLTLGLDLVHIPFGGGGPAVAAVVAGHAPIGFNALTPVVPQVKEGKLRALAVTSKTRSQIVPEVPTMTEAGYPDIEGDSWVGILVPAGTPKEIIGVLYREIAKIIALPEMKERLAALGFEPVVSVPDEFGRQIGAEIETWGRVIRAANIRTN